MQDTIVGLYLDLHNVAQIAGDNEELNPAETAKPLTALRSELPSRACYYADYGPSLHRNTYSDQVPGRDVVVLRHAPQLGFGYIGRSGLFPISAIHHTQRNDDEGVQYDQILSQGSLSEAIVPGAADAQPTDKLRSSWHSNIPRLLKSHYGTCVPLDVRKVAGKDHLVTQDEHHRAVKAHNIDTTLSVV